MKEVSEFEARLLRILRCLMHRASIDQTLALLVQPVARPRCLSRTCVELIQDGLSKGVTAWLARSGWMNARTLRNGDVASGRLWLRHHPSSMALTFSRNSMELLIWLTAENFAEPTVPLELDANTVTIGDRLLMLMTFSALRTTVGVNVLVRQSGFSTHGLTSILFPESAALIPGFSEPNLGFWFQPETTWVLEALQSRLRGSGLWSRTPNVSRQITTMFSRLVSISRECSMICLPMLSVPEEEICAYSF